MVVFLTGVLILCAVLGLFWLKDAAQSPALARLAYSGLVARLAVLGAVLAIIGVMLMLSDVASRWLG